MPAVPQHTRNGRQPIGGIRIRLYQLLDGGVLIGSPHGGNFEGSGVPVGAAFDPKSLNGRPCISHAALGQMGVDAGEIDQPQRYCTRGAADLYSQRLHLRITGIEATKRQFGVQAERKQ